MLSFSASEIVLVAVVALIVFGPEQLPRVASQCGAWLRQLKQSAAHIQRALEHDDPPHSPPSDDPPPS